MNMDSGNLASNLANNEGVGSQVAGGLGKGSGIGNIAGGQGQNGAKNTGMVGQASDVLDEGMSKITGEEVGPKVGTDAKELGTEEKINPETGEVTEENTFKEGDKVGNGKVVGEDGKVQGSSTRRLMTDVGTGVATYYGGAEAGKAVYQLGQNNELVGKVADTVDKVPGVKQVSDQLEEEGVLDTAEGAFEAFNAAKSKDIKGTIEGAKKAKKGLKKFKKKLIKRLILALAPAFLFFVMLFCMASLANYGFNKLLEVFIADDSNGGYYQVQPGSESSSTTSDRTDLKLRQFFPDGVPTTQEEIEKYIVSVEVPITNKDGSRTTTVIRVHKDVKDQVVDVLQQAQNAGFKVYSVAGYSFRNVRGSTTNLSQHAYGLAIDINPNENYYIKGSTTIGSYYKPGDDEYSMPEDGVVVKAFKSYGWDWGGDWKSLKDYMHFSAAGG